MVLFAIKCGDYVDLLDKKSNLSGAFIGGVILAAVTSLPELFTSFTALYIGQTDLITGNIIGSNLFNLGVLGIMTAISTKHFLAAKVSTSHRVVCIGTLFSYAAIAFYFIVKSSIPWLSWIPTIVMVVVYIFGIRKLSAAEESGDDEEDNSKLTLFQVSVRFVICAVCLVIASILITRLTDQISERLQLGKTFAGALLLGVVTSLPELSSSVMLLKRRNFNAMAGNMIGSNIFNCVILALCDVLTFTNPIYTVSVQSVVLLCCVIASSIAAILLLTAQKRKANLNLTRFVGILPVVSYLVFLMFGR